jgi:fluoride ion exporter CrcB/FEX
VPSSLICPHLRAGIPSLYAPDSSHRGINVTVLLFNLIGCFIIAICTAFKQVPPRHSVIIVE